MQYEKAIQLWGAEKLRPLANYGQVVNPDKVTVEFDFAEGYACCGGSDPNCYCSFAESPRADVRIVCHYPYVTRDISIQDFDFATLIRELVEIADGSLTSE